MHTDGVPVKKNGPFMSERPNQPPALPHPHSVRVPGKVFIFTYTPPPALFLQNRIGSAFPSVCPSWEQSVTMHTLLLHSTYTIHTKTPPHRPAPLRTARDRPFHPARTYPFLSQIFQAAGTPKACCRGAFTVGTHRQTHSNKTNRKHSRPKLQQGQLLQRRRHPDHCYCCECSRPSHPA